MKRCIDCGETKLESDFYICKSTVDKLRPECKSCQKQRRADNLRLKKKNHPAYVRARTLAYKYGLTLETFNNMIEAQNGKCAICQGPKDINKGWSVDHCHRKSTSYFVPWV